MSESEADRKLREANQDPAYKKMREEKLKKFRGQGVEVEDIEEDEKETRVKVSIESKNDLERSKLWNQMLDDLKKGYEGLGKTFDPNSVHSKEDMEFHFDTLVRLQRAEREKAEKVKESPSGGGVPLSAAQYDNDSVIPANWEDLPLDLIPFDSEEAMIKALKREASQNFNLERKREAVNLLQQLYGKSLREPQTWELESELKDTQKTEFDEKGNPIGRKRYRLVRKR